MNFKLTADEVVKDADGGMFPPEYGDCITYARRFVWQDDRGQTLEATYTAMVVAYDEDGYPMDPEEADEDNPIDYWGSEWDVEYRLMDEATEQIANDWRDADEMRYYSTPYGTDSTKREDIARHTHGMIAELDAEHLDADLIADYTLREGEIQPR